jgi:hypothetical protein
LNGDRLGQSILDPNLFGLTTHVATLRDWADAGAARTIGKRRAQGTYRDVFGGPNPYSALFVADRFGAHCKLPNLPVEDEGPFRELTIDSVAWSDDDVVPKDIRDQFAKDRRLCLLAHVKEWRGWDALKAFTQDVDQRFLLEAGGQSPLALTSSTGGVTNQSGSIRWVVIPLDASHQSTLARGTSYTLRPRNEKPPLKWKVVDGLTVTRK